MTRTARQDARRSGKEDAGRSLFWKNVSSDFTGNTIVKLERGLVGTWLVDNFSPASDVTSLKTPSRHVPTRPLSNFTIVFPVKSEEAFFFQMYASHP